MVTVGCDGLDVEMRYVLTRILVADPPEYLGGQLSHSIAPYLYLTPLAKWKTVYQHLAMTRDVARSDADVTPDRPRSSSGAEHAQCATASATALCKHAVVTIDDLMVRQCSTWCWALHVLSQRVC